VRSRTAPRAIVTIAVAGLIAAGCQRGPSKESAVKASLERTLAQPRPPYVTADAEGRKLWKLTQQFYERRQREPAWIDGTAPAPHVAELITALNAAIDEGLDPHLYNATLLEQKRHAASKGFLSKKGFEPAEGGQHDVWLTYLYLKYASDLADGLSDLAHADATWQIRPEKFDPAAHLENALTSNKVEKSLRDLAPGDSQYQALRRALADYRALAAKGGWAPLPRTLRLSKSQTSRAAGLIARRLAASGDYSGAVPGADGIAPYSVELQEAVKRFQRRHGLTDDGIISPAVIAEMNVPAEQRVAEIALNMERWRWLPRDLGDRYILVNIPEYRLEVWDHGQVPLAMRVVVGKQDTQTPIFTDQMTHVVFSPYWNVPPGIAQGETLPEVLKDPGFLARNNMEVLGPDGQPIDPASIDLSEPTRYKFRQRPGAQNSLGLVKFMFPNQYNVYLHDTPADSLFARASRSFSHGCVRLENPLALAQYVLRDQPDWTKEKIEEAMHAEEERTVKLRSAIPVYLGYWTARASSDGVLQFRRDVYGIDSRLSRLLAERLSRLRKSAAAAASSANRTSASPASGSSIE